MIERRRNGAKVVLSLESVYYLSTIAAAWLGLIGLFCYVRKTKEQVDATLAQLEGSSRPCVLFLEDTDELLLEFSARNLILQNVGSGPALNIRWRLSAWSEWATAPVLSPDGSLHHFSVQPGLTATDVDAAGGAECEFQSLGGKTDGTTASYVRVPPNNVILLKHSFYES